MNDYEAGPYTISFAEGQTRACTDIPIVDDDVHEPEQDFTVSMEVPSGLPLRPGDNATVTITDDDRKLFPINNTHLIRQNLSCSMLVCIYVQ